MYFESDRAAHYTTLFDIVAGMESLLNWIHNQQPLTEWGMGGYTLCVFYTVM